MRHRHVLLLAFLPGTLAAAARPAPQVTAPAVAGQQADESVQAGLARIRTALLSGTADLQRAIADLRALLGSDPSSAEAHLLLGLAYRGLGEYPMLVEAIAEFRQALALDARLMAVHYYLANAYLDLDTPARAREELLVALAALPDQQQFRTLLIEAERRTGNAARAVELAREVLAAQPSSTEARYYLGKALFDLKRRAEALTEFERLVADGARLPDVFLQLGNAYLEDGRIDDATNMMVSAAGLAPTRGDIRLALARTYRKKGLLTDAERQLAQVLPPGSAVEASSYYENLQADLHREIGILRLQQQRPDDALVSLQRALGLRPDDGPTHRYLAETLLELGRIEEARTHLARATAVSAEVPDALRAAIAAGAPAAKGQE